jgi:beta-mannanase
MEHDLGHTLAIHHTFDRWGDSIPTPQEKDDVAQGRVPYINVHGIPSARILSGAEDGYIRGLADGLRDLQAPVMFQYFGEFDRRPVSMIGTPAEFVRAWKHMYEIFAQEGATNVAWVWCPTGSGLTGKDPRAVPFYPGDDYVDWGCFDTYDWGGVRGSEHRSFADAAMGPYRWLVQNLPGKPLVVGEFGSVEDPHHPGAKAAWLSDAADTIETQMPELKAVVYFDTVARDSTPPIDWRLRSSSSAWQAWIDWGQRPYFSVAPSAP